MIRNPICMVVWRGMVVTFGIESDYLTLSHYPHSILILNQNIHFRLQIDIDKAFNERDDKKSRATKLEKDFKKCESERKQLLSQNQDITAMYHKSDNARSVAEKENEVCYSSNVYNMQDFTLQSNVQM